MKPWLILRSTVLWILSALHFLVMVLVLILLALPFGHRGADSVARFFCRNVVRLMGARLEVRFAPGYDPKRMCFFASNHVNVFDPFVLVSAIPQCTRALELESHFRVPVYGWLMHRYGNVPVPVERSAAGLKRTYRLAREALESGVNLVVFPEGHRTRTGELGAFESGVFRMARQLRYPIVPVTIEGAFDVFRTGSLLLRPGTITVHVHEAIDPASMPRDELSDHVRKIIAAPLHDV